MASFRNRIESRRAERAAPQQAPDGQPSATARTMDRDRLEAVLRTRWKEPARRGATIEGPLVQQDHPHHDPLHGTAAVEARCRTGIRIEPTKCSTSVLTWSNVNSVVTRRCGPISRVPVGKVA